MRLSFRSNSRQGEEKVKIGTYLELSLQVLFFAEACDLGVASCRGIPRVGRGEVGLIFGVGLEEFGVGRSKDVIGVQEFEEIFVVLA